MQQEHRPDFAVSCDQKPAVRRQSENVESRAISTRASITLKMVAATLEATNPPELCDVSNRVVITHHLGRGRERRRLDDTTWCPYHYLFENTAIVPSIESNERRSNETWNSP